MKVFIIDTTNTIRPTVTKTTVRCNCPFYKPVRETVKEWTPTKADIVNSDMNFDDKVKLLKAFGYTTTNLDIYDKRDLVSVSPVYLW